MIHPLRGGYFPLADGNQWEYRLVTTFERDSSLDTTTIATYHHRIAGSTKLADGRPAWIRIWESQVTLRDTALPESTFTQAETTYFRQTKQAIYRYLTKDSKADSILLLPISIDQNWNSNDVTYRVAAREDIRLNGKTYLECWRVKSLAAGDPVTVNSWFARGFGLVRMVSERTLSGKILRTDYHLVGTATK